MAQTWIALSLEEAAAAVALNGAVARVEPRIVDNPAAGALLGRYVLPARIFDDADYADWLTPLGQLPRVLVADAALFASTQES